MNRRCVFSSLGRFPFAAAAPADGYGVLFPVKGCSPSARICI